MDKILAIETSCDETAAAVVSGGRTILSNVVYTQIDIHARYGGVVPEVASRAHIDKIDGVADEALKTAGLRPNELDAVAVTYAPGLVGALLVGVGFAKAFAFASGLPIIAVHHIEGHVCANYIETRLEPPFVCLVASGGHTNLVNVKSHYEYKLLGTTVDDAAGEAFDKAARALGLPYPGGVQIARLAEGGDKRAIAFPRAMSGTGGGLNFSFSGLKSAVLNYLNTAKMAGLAVNDADVAASFQEAAVDVLAEKALSALEATGLGTLALAGGVACNKALRERLTGLCAEKGIELFMPPPELCADNAAMIGARAHYDYVRGKFAGLEMNAAPPPTLTRPAPYQKYLHRRLWP